MSVRMTPEWLAEIRPLARQYLVAFPNHHNQIHIGNLMAMEWERIVDQADEADRLRTKVAAIKAIPSRACLWEESGIYGRGVSDVEILWALDAGGGVQP